MCSAQLSVSDIPGKPMPLGELAALMSADDEKLTKVMATSGMWLQRAGYSSS